MTCEIGFKPSPSCWWICAAADWKFRFVFAKTLKRKLARFHRENPTCCNPLRAFFAREFYAPGVVRKEVLRRNLRGFPPKHDRPASSSSGTVERGEHDTFPVNKAKPLLRQGRNLLAFQVHNHRIGSSDLTLIPELVYAPDTPAKVMEGVQKVQELMHLRGVYSTKQLQAVLGEFWENHFCTDFDKVKD